MAELSVNRIAVIRYKDKSVACKDAISFGELILDFETKIMYKVLQKIPANTTLETAIDNESVEVVSAFDENGIVTSGLFFWQPIETKTLNGTSQWDIDDLRTMMRVILSGSTNTIILPNGGENPFRFQIIVVQDSTGSRALTISGASGVNVFNPSEFDFSGGSANQLCVCTIIWDCNEYIYECTNYVGGN